MLLDITAIPWLSISECVRPIQQNAENLNSQRQNNDKRADGGAGVYVPSPLLRRPYNTYEDWMETRAPEEEWGGPGEIGEELVMERSCAEQANCERRQHHCHYE